MLHVLTVAPIGHITRQSLAQDIETDDQCKYWERRGIFEVSNQHGIKNDDLYSVKKSSERRVGDISDNIAIVFYNIDLFPKCSKQSVVVVEYEPVEISKILETKTGICKVTDHIYNRAKKFIDDYQKHDDSKRQLLLLPIQHYVNYVVYNKRSRYC